ncbi:MULTISPECIES: UDP-3-O-(3-hydroxymyristoyl)glucosamine N-acyltransferase [Chryseobacterium]|jgi:UDP-3-O-[3-hydroxymyristoyl] glucosamine N-acyltransferase|uniref:UDP-3-O-acylglucosamine N-acyltransferase n=1 Tax=Chryseobacterium rhizosphaerae TaxID=395937 RepID=A0AAE3Y9X9_9FLAO|nr:MULTISPECIES: UDP-3-O-(3-hydroxymyristoyl)glucosamine N-acyltransferase [Chryseobacterium]MBL3547366.1 UDP-3-O-(3-hydroxymyristoyl)glucosamine N-acyltransferase [Chryseobacterium sp. KMC2]MDR6527694.1 UDP-3-O-[3-hydroxymyristoyl] glucosamine N-acyltransferase [Chryseobacterium rhizosphaerae]MDR6548085.1 UDP-3-O-[3-hydroxymyristoyl] glucosamine N-acyltransferase [Chryseobacterium rhizosphaerae]REC76517.1 UDP-3-O-(3-hydroxymyristoyl)glucosamine N-acyltransferase [Chryseobacterium rhizosphaerae
MEFTASQIASFIDGKIIGDETALITGVSPIENGESGHLSFIAQDRFSHFLDTSKCSVIIVSEKLIVKDSYNPTLIVVKDAYLSFQVLMNLYQEMRGRKEGVEDGSSIHDTAVIGDKAYIGAFTYVSEKAKIGDGSQIYPHVYIGKGVKIGKNCKIDSGARIYDYCIIGDNCVIHSNTVVGGDGFGFQPTAEGFKKIPQLGNVIIEDDVEIGSNCSIDRATIGSTIIGKGTKIDNLIQIAHNVKIGQNNVIAAQAGIAGSTTIGDWNQIGGQVGIVGHIKIGNQVKIQAQSGVNSSVNDKETLYGSPAISYNDYLRNYVHFRNFTEIVSRINNLENNSKDHTNE